MELAHASYKFQQQCNRTQAILEAYVSQVPCEIDENCTQIDMVEINSNVTDIAPNEVDNEDEFSETFNLNSGSPSCENQQSLECEVEKVESFNLNENKTVLENTLIACEDDSNISENMIFIKQESYSTVLEAAKVAASDDNDKLCQKLEGKRKQSHLTDNASETKKSMSRLNFNYYVKETVNGEKVN